MEKWHKILVNSAIIFFFVTVVLLILYFTKKGNIYAIVSSFSGIASSGLGLLSDRIGSKIQDKKMDKKIANIKIVSKEI